MKRLADRFLASAPSFLAEWAALKSVPWEDVAVCAHLANRLADAIWAQVRAGNADATREGFLSSIPPLAVIVNHDALMPTDDIKEAVWKVLTCLADTDEVGNHTVACNDQIAHAARSVLSSDLQEPWQRTACEVFFSVCWLDLLRLLLATSRTLCASHRTRPRPSRSATGLLPVY